MYMTPSRWTVRDLSGVPGSSPSEEPVRVTSMTDGSQPTTPDMSMSPPPLANGILMVMSTLADLASVVFLKAAVSALAGDADEPSLFASESPPLHATPVVHSSAVVSTAPMIRGFLLVCIAPPLYKHDDLTADQ